MSVGLSMYYLSKTLIDGEKGRIAGIISAIFFMCNPHMMYHIAQTGVKPLLASVALPIMLASYIKGLNLKQNTIRYVLLIAIFSTFLMASNPANIIIGGFLFLAYLIFTIVDHITQPSGVDIKHYFKFNIYIIVVCLIMNLWWIAPMVHSLIFTPSMGGYGAVIATAVDHLNAISPLYTRLLEVFRLLGTNMPYDYMAFYNTPLGIITSFCMVIIAFGALFLKPKDKYVIFFSVLTIFSIFLNCGLSPPSKDVFWWLWTHFSAFQVLRNPYKLATISLIGYSFLIGVFASEVVTRLNNTNIYRKKLIFLNFIPQRATSKIFCFALLALIFVNSAPLFEGNLSSNLYPVHLPSYYEEARAWLSEQQDDFRVLILPQQRFLQLFTWAPLSTYSQSYILPHIFPKPIVLTIIGGGGAAPSSNVFQEFVYNVINYDKTENIGKILGLLNVKYVLIRNDTVSYIVPIDFPASYVKPIIDSQYKLHYNITFGSLTFYENEDNISHIYASTNTILVSGGLNSLIPWSYMNDGSSSALLFIEQQLNYLNSSELLEISNSILLANSHIIDLVCTLSDQKYFLEPADAIMEYNYETTWIPVGINDIIAEKSSINLLRNGEIPIGSKYIVPNGIGTIKIDFVTDSAEEYDVFIRTNTKSANYGLLNISVNEIVFPPLHSQPSPITNDVFRWLFVGSIDLSEGNQVLSIHSDGYDNAVDEFLIIPHGKFMNDYEHFINMTYTNNSNFTYIFDNNEFAASSIPTQINGQLYIPKSGEYILSIAGKKNLDLSKTLLQITKNGSSPSFFTINQYMIDPRIHLSGIVVKSRDFTSMSGEWEDARINIRSGSVNAMRTDADNVSLVYDIKVSTSGNYNFILNGVAGPGYGKFNVDLDGTHVAQIDLGTGYALVESTTFEIGEYQLDAGNHQLKIVTDSPRIGDWVHIIYFNLVPHDITDPNNNNLNSQGDEIIYSSLLVKEYNDTNKQSFQWMSDPLNLEQGTYNINLDGPNLDVDKTILLIKPITKLDDDAISGTSEVNYQKVNPTKYVAHVTTENPFLLVFSESYDPGWKAYINGEEVTKHIMVNGYANGWYISNIGEYTVEIVYEPQKIFLVSVILSGVSGIIGILYIFYRRH
jgi:hypothetical protein